MAGGAAYLLTHTVPAHSGLPKLKKNLTLLVGKAGKCAASAAREGAGVPCAGAPPQAHPMGPPDPPLGAPLESRATTIADG